MMARGALLALLFLMLPLSMLSNFTHADPLWLFTYCDPNTTDYTINSTFGNNLKALLEALPSYTSSSSGFNNTSVGEIPDKAYGQALCRGDVNSSVCQNCVENASQEIQKKCLSKDALIWYQYCQIHYSFQNFSSTSVYTGKYPDWDGQEKNVSDPAHFYQFVVYLITELSSEAAKNSSRLMFATGELRYSRSDTIYGLVQCTRDISADDCSNCLNQATEELNACCYGKQGGIMLSRNCDVRYELYSFYNATGNLLTHPSSKGNSWKPWMFAPLAVVVVVVATAPFVVRIWRRRGIMKDEEQSQHALLQELATTRGVAMTEEGNLVSTEEMPLMDLIAIRAATDDFSDANKLGQGGFGTVYKGTLPDGKEIAIKRLSRRSWQGMHEFRNEVMLIAKLQHRNLVRLLGCATEGDEKLLIYEFMPNKSLDTFIFDSDKRAELGWNTCHNIIVGIARGLLYLHEESRLKIIHRDLKPNNVLLDNEMVAKISDFGMARMFGENQNTANTKRVVGTYGYMSPEYAMEGIFSVKSDVFSYGVIVLEIISGKKNSGFYVTGLAQTLLAYAWRLWNEGEELEFVEPTLLQKGKVEEIVRCIHIGLLCVQEDADDRPPMSHVVALLGNEPITLPQPKEPAFAVGRVVPFCQPPSTDPPFMPSPSTDPSANCVKVSDIDPW